MPTLAEIRRVAEDARPALDSYTNCNPINPRICDALTDAFDIDATVVEGEITSYRMRGHGEEHAFIHIPKSDVDDAPSDVIVDGAADQFRDEYKDDRFFITLGPREAFHDSRVEVLTRRHDFYDAYSFTHR